MSDRVRQGENTGRRTEANKIAKQGTVSQSKTGTKNAREIKFLPRNQKGIQSKNRERQMLQHPIETGSDLPMMAMN
jgi:hypothetical protein